MKNNIFLGFFLLCALNVFAQDYFLAAPQGFGAATTGGGSVAPVTVTTYATLKSNIIAAGAKVILVSGEITIPSGQPISAIVTNKSIIGLPGAKLINENQSNPGAGILYLKTGSSNVIIRNLIFVGPGAYDIDGQDNLTADGCTNLWVDHCEFQDGQDGNFDIKNLSDNVSVSWCKFTYLKPAVAGGSGGSNDHRFSNLIGASASNAPADGHYSVTFQNCYWANGCKDRMPRARNAELHIVSCYYNTTVSGSKAIGLGGGTNDSTCYVENCNFDNVGSVFSNATSDGGTVAINYSNCLSGGNNIGTVTAPTYTISAIPVDEVQSHLTDATCGAGATLQVTATGEISSGICTSLGNDDNYTVLRLVSYDTLVTDTLKIYIENTISGNADIAIYSTNGQEVFSASKNVGSDKMIVLDLTALQAGIYVCKVVINEQKLNWKFVKN
jgi:pectate lyase